MDSVTAWAQGVLLRMLQRERRLEQQRFLMGAMYHVTARMNILEDPFSKMSPRDQHVLAAIAGWSETHGDEADQQHAAILQTRLANAQRPDEDEEFIFI